MEVIELQGHVTRSGKGIAATLRWEAANTGARYDTVADEDGLFHLLVAQKGLYGVGLRPAEGASFARDVEVRESGTHDFDAPANAVTVLVTSSNGMPVAEARVAYDVRRPPPQSEQLETGSPMTDSSGRVVLPPLPVGSLSIRVTAKGYRAGTAGPLDITPQTAAPQVDVVLGPGAGIRLSLREPGGSPAGGARVWSEQWMTRADAAGVAVCEEELTVGEPLVAFDSLGRMGFFRYAGGQDQLLAIPESGPPLVVRFMTPEGAPLAGRHVILGVDGVFDTKILLEQRTLSGSDWLSRQDGTLRLGGIPGTGSLTIYPSGRPDLAVHRALPVAEEIPFTESLEGTAPAH
ncbi:MAG: carboxypeptidase regulatory-like domain-containing protein [Holophagales bacterium]|nr:carboxypeptidase regulatory-like domain-containing protein [Holophagales bacterium]